MDISVIETTARLGGLDMLFDSMKRQEFRGEFEVIVSDEFHEARRMDDRDIFRKYGDGFAFVHLPPKRPCSIYDDSLGINTALARASGELVVVLADYTWVPPDYLQSHWDFYKTNPV